MAYVYEGHICSQKKQCLVITSIKKKQVGGESTSFNTVSGETVQASHRDIHGEVVCSVAATTFRALPQDTTMSARAQVNLRSGSYVRRAH